jgi:hypothetical protein
VKEASNKSVSRIPVKATIRHLADKQKQKHQKNKQLAAE